MQLRLVSWNVHGCVGTDRRFEPHRTADALARLAPDVALLQEVGDNRGVHPPVDQAATLANHLGLTCAVGITLKHSHHGYGNATLTRFPVLDSESLDLSVFGRERRICLRVTVGRDDFQLTTLNVHLGLAPGERRRQLKQLLHFIDGADRVVLGGDFNDFPPGPVTFTLRHRMYDVSRKLRSSRTFPSRFPFLRLDRVYLSPDVHWAEARVVRSPELAVASDHLPLVVELEVPDQS
jgi:endonuclease/exonuclease/phosphatase family metal-dependent hydrolase